MPLTPYPPVFVAYSYHYPGQALVAVRKFDAGRRRQGFPPGRRRRRRVLTQMVTDLSGVRTGVTMLAKRWYPSAQLMPDGFRMVFLSWGRRPERRIADALADKLSSYRCHHAGQTLVPVRAPDSGRRPHGVPRRRRPGRRVADARADKDFGRFVQVSPCWPSAGTRPHT